MNRKKRTRYSKSTLFMIALSVIVIAGTYLVLIIPTALKNRLPGVAVISPITISYTPSVDCKGIIEYSELYSITADMPVVLSRVFVARGDKVDEGQAIAEIDKEKTIAVLSELYGDTGFESGELYTALRKAGERVVATDSGVIYDIARKGEVIMSGDDIVQIGRDNNLSMTAVVSEKSISKVGVGQQVEIIAEAVEEGFSGEVVSVSSLASKLNNGMSEEAVVEVEITIKGDTKKLKSGYTASGKILTGLPSSLLTLPYSAICQDDKGEYVYVFEKGRAAKRYIRTGRELSDCTEVSGLMQTDFVIDRPEGLKDGMLVKAREGTE
ncbi:MAG: HlyD family efflux transporter periplasmic adaptor subunit [Ruminiclostridium sp.]|nr:HlyD family efflux transporter periplasmic adaptor subunit [Ruminiclostridium sp.]